MARTRSQRALQTICEKREPRSAPAKRRRRRGIPNLLSLHIQNRVPRLSGLTRPKPDTVRGPPELRLYNPFIHHKPHANSVHLSCGFL